MLMVLWYSCVEIGSSEWVSVEYAQQLLLTVLHQICSSISGQSKEELKGLQKKNQKECDVL